MVNYLFFFCFLEIMECIVVIKLIVLLIFFVGLRNMSFKILYLVIFVVVGILIGVFGWVMNFV